MGDPADTSEEVMSENDEKLCDHTRATIQEKPHGIMRRQMFRVVCPECSESTQWTMYLKHAKVEWAAKEPPK